MNRKRETQGKVKQNGEMFLRMFEKNSDMASYSGLALCQSNSTRDLGILKNGNWMICSNSSFESHGQNYVSCLGNKTVYRV
jgi:hypothetical protein